TLIVKRQLEEILGDACRGLLENEALPSYLPKRRWFAAKQSRISRVHILYAVRIEDDRHSMLLSELEVQHSQGTDRYLLPLGFLGEDDRSGAMAEQLALARVRRGRDVGLLTDALGLDAFALRILDLLRSGASLPCEGGEIRFVPTPALSELELPDDVDVAHNNVEQSNSSVIIGHKVVLKLFRRLEPGLHPEAEIGHYLSEHGFEHVPPLYGEVARRNAAGESQTLMLVQGFIANQGDAWSWTRNALERAIREVGEESETSAEEGGYKALDELEEFATTLGQRLGELHRVLALPSENADFAPEQAGETHVAAWSQRVREQVEKALDLLERHKGNASEADQALAEQVLSERDTLLSAVEPLAQQAKGSLLTRIHGDLHLGQVLVAHDDAYIIDFEGEPARSLEERRAKDCPLRDVAGMLRSFDYAGAKMDEAVAGKSHDESAAEMAHDVAERYLVASRRAFLEAYWQSAADIAHRWASHDGANAALELFVLEKTVYEIAYEAANRPAWLGVPLRGLAAIVDQLSTRGAHD
ncbi:putative maltokinase, partial [Halomonas sp. BBD48]|nr:putative maltokinase [Halomonas sp. BBD48]